MRRLVVYAIFLGAAIVTAAVGIDLLIDSDEERVARTVDEVRAAVEAGDLTRTLPLLDLEGDGFDLVIGGDREKFRSSDVDALEERAADGSEWLGGTTVGFEPPTIVIEGVRAHAYSRVRVIRETDEASFPVDLTLRREGDRWVVTRLRAMPPSRQARGDRFGSDS